MRLLPRVLTLMLAFASLAPRSTFAQTTPADDGLVRSRLHLAQEYEREGNFEEALELYEQVAKTHPEHPRVLRGRKTCLLELKRYDDLMVILERELTARPGQPDLFEELGTVAARKGDREAAALWWEKILVAQEGSRAAYSFVAELMRRHRMLDEALEVYAVADSVHPGRFTRQRATLHEQRFEFDEATDGYLDYLERSPTGLSYVEGRLLRIGEAEEGLQNVIDRVERRMTRRRSGLGPADPAIPPGTVEIVFRKLMGDLYLEAADYESARRHYFALVDEAPSQYASLLVFGKRCQADDEYDVAIRVFDRIVEEFPNGRAVPSALSEIASCQAALERWDDALVTYARIEDQYPETDFAWAARYDSGRVLRDGKGRSAEAEILFRDLISLPRGPWGEADPQFEVAECAIWQGDPERARGIYRAIEARQFSEETRARALFEEARALYYTSEFVLADSLFKEVAQRYPRGDHVNDALEFSILINTNPDPPELVEKYASARFNLRIQQPDAAIEILERFAVAHPGAALSDESFLLLGHAYREVGDYQRALDALLRAVADAQVPDLAAQARLLRAEILAEDLADVPAALFEYEELLVAYPETLAADRARDLSADLTRMLP